VRLGRALTGDHYPSRGAIDARTWLELAEGAKESIDLLAYAGSFLHDSIPGFIDHVAERSDNGVRVRLLFGDPSSDAVALRGREEEIDDLMAARCRLTWKYLAPCVKAHRMQARQHGTTLYASIFRFDDVLLANPHAYGSSASQSPSHPCCTSTASPAAGSSATTWTPTTRSGPPLDRSDRAHVGSRDGPH
jgi:hypothetical protein